MWTSIVVSKFNFEIELEEEHDVGLQNTYNVQVFLTDRP